MSCEMPECSTCAEPKAVKEHICVECAGVITKGERYQRLTGLWDGRWETYKTCMDCVAIRCEISSDEWDECIPLGNLRHEVAYDEQTLARFNAVAEARKVVA